MAHNGDIALETMKAVDHPNIRINFDTGNVYYYNHDVTAVAEVQKIIVRSVLYTSRIQTGNIGHGIFRPSEKA